MSDFGIQIKACVDSVYPLLRDALPVKTQLFTTLVLSLLMFVVSLPNSLASKSVICTTWLSIFLYTAWLVAALYNHTTGTVPSPTLLQRCVLWNDTSKYAEIFLCA